jgi:hypothetical protein
MLEWEDEWGQNGGRGMVVAREGMLPPIVCDRDAFIPLYGIYLYLLILAKYIYFCAIFARRMLEWEPYRGYPQRSYWSRLSAEMLTKC